MPTDEQRMREQFEAWVGEHIKQWEAPGTTPAEHEENVKHWLVMSDGEHFDHHATQGWWTGWKARDAEVQALREALRKIAWLDTGENSSHSDALDALTKIEVIAFAALAGGETGGTE